MSPFAKDFPILSTKVNNNRLVYLDNASTTLKPNVVIDAVNDYYANYSANVHRGVHSLSERASAEYEKARKKVASFINARSDSEIVFTSGTTGGLNLLANSFSKILQAGDEILISELEHHSNIVPWQLFCQPRGVILKKIPMLPSSDLDLKAFQDLLNPKVKIVAVTAMSNALGTINPLKTMIPWAHEVGAKVVVDAAQSIAHERVDVQDLDCDFLVFSGHKLLGPTGVGVMYGKRHLLNDLPPSFGGGGMIQKVTIEASTFSEAPERFEAGTPHISGVLGLYKAIEYIESLGFDEIKRIEDDLDQHCQKVLASVRGLSIVGTPLKRAGIYSFVLKGVHPHDIGTLLDQDGVAVRSGHHCCQPIMTFYNLPATTRVSFSFYNSRSDIDVLGDALNRVREMFE